MFEIKFFAPNSLSLCVAVSRQSPRSAIAPTETDSLYVRLHSTHARAFSLVSSAKAFLVRMLFQSSVHGLIGTCFFSELEPAIESTTTVSSAAPLRRKVLAVVRIGLDVVGT